MIISPKQRAAKRRGLAVWIGGNLVLLALCGAAIAYHVQIRHLFAMAVGET
jgi:hypothetical protein